MKDLSLFEIATACNGTLNNKNYGDLYITSITTDSRKISDKTLFVPLKGSKVDGHDFIMKTFENGAVCSLSEKDVATDKPVIKVKSCYQAVKDIAEYYRSLFHIPFIGISGSVGKTSTKEMIASILSQKFKVHKTQGNFNNELGVPLTLFGLEEYHEVAVIEMGISGFGEMTRLSKMVRPDICVITSIGDCHLENLGDRDGVLKAKTEMFTYRNKNGKIFLCGDNPHLATVKRVDDTQTVFYGIENNGINTYYAKDIVNKSADGISCTLCTPNEEFTVTIPAIGNYMVANALVGVAIGEYLGMNAESMAKGVASYKTVGSRDGIIKTDFLTIIDDCYNASPISVKGGVDNINTFQGRKVCILGDMKELGKNSPQLHFETGKYVQSQNIDVLIAIGTLAKDLADGCQGGNTAVYWFETVQKAKENLKNILLKNDNVLVKASRAMQFENVVSFLKEISL